MEWKKTVTAVVIALTLIAVVDVGAKTTTDNSMSAIEKLVGAGKLGEAASRLQNSYRLDNRSGLQALRQFSILVLRQGLKEKDPYERCYAAGALGAVGDPLGAKILEAAFSSPDPGMRMAATDGLGDMGNATATAVLQRLYHYGDAYARRLAIEGLAQINNPEAATVLVSATDESDDATRLIAAEALGRLGDTQALPRLRRLLQTEKKPLNEVMTAHSLLLLGDDSGLEMLLAIVHGQGAVDYRAAATLALADARDPRAEAVLKQAQGDPAIDVRMAAAGALTHYNDPEGVQLLITAMRDEDPITRRDVSKLLEHLDFGVGREAVLSALSSPDQGLRLEGIHAIGMLGSDKDIGVLENTLQQTDDPIMRAGVASALGRLARPGCIAPLLALVQESDPAVRNTAADALARTSSRLLGQIKTAGK